jgi:hypothetical protein
MPPIAFYRLFRWYEWFTADDFKNVENSPFQTFLETAVL